MDQLWNRAPSGAVQGWRHRNGHSEIPYADDVQIEPPGSQGLLGIPDAARGIIFAKAWFLKHPAGRALHG
jgi:hypothetical protein